jgi:hypothetical protein
MNSISQNIEGWNFDSVVYKFDVLWALFFDILGCVFCLKFIVNLTNSCAWVDWSWKKNYVYCLSNPRRKKCMAPLCQLELTGLVNLQSTVKDYIEENPRSYDARN